MKKGLSPFLAPQEACDAQGVSSRITAFGRSFNLSRTHSKGRIDLFKKQIFKKDLSLIPAILCFKIFFNSTVVITKPF